MKTNMQEIKFDLALIAREYSDLGHAVVAQSALDDTLLVEFASGYYAEFDMDLFRPGGGHWRAVVRHELNDLRARVAPNVPLRLPASAPPPPEAKPSRAEKIKAAMDGIARGDHLPSDAFRRRQLDEIAKHLAPSFPFNAMARNPMLDFVAKGARDPLALTARQRGHGAETALGLFVLAQRESVRVPLTDYQREAASAAWSRALRGRVAQSRDRERHQVLVDLQDEP